MRFTQYYIPTLKEDPSESELRSHSLSLRAGLIRKVASGIYTYLPLGLRVLRKIENIVREEMNRAGAIELMLSVIQPSDLWQKSERWDQYGPEMFRLKDRNQRDFCLGPTHEELITYLAYLDLKSYKELPVNLYQIQTKFRDEIRPRYGLLRAREFIMKDAYSFCKNPEELDEVYQAMYKAYSRITERLGLEYLVVEADTGLIGGSFSHEFIILAEQGEEVMVLCPDCGYSAKQEEAIFKAGNKSPEEDKKELKMVHTPEVSSIEKLSDFLGVAADSIVKSLVMEGKDGSLYAFLVSGERELDIDKASKVARTELGMVDQSLAHDLNLGFFGPIGAREDIKFFADNSIKGKINFIIGANKRDHHYINANYGRDFKVDDWGSFTYPVEGDWCKHCGSRLTFKKGIEIGHIFKLGTKYSRKLEASFLDKDGKRMPFQMGCYGIGVSRIMSAAIEQLSDDDGIIWPESIAPFDAEIIVINADDEAMVQAADKIYGQLCDMDIDVLYDDRNIRAGIKFKDASLIGIPVRLIVGKNTVQKGIVELEFRKGRQKEEVELKDLPQFMAQIKQLQKT
ncbi:MAG: proline--tRNA ligase [Actinomycetia bacterium]|nr:proline--tRNA ligase [Actinomycetes bacterium]